MTNSEIKPLFAEIIPQVMMGNMERSSELAELLLEYTWSYSKLSSILKSDMQFLHNLLKQSEDTEATTLGKVVHALSLFQPMSEFVFEEKIDRRKKEGKEQEKRWKLLKTKGKTVLSNSVLIKAKKCFWALMRDVDCKNVLITGGPRERWYEMDYQGFKIGGFLDLETMSAVELKTTADANPEEFKKSAIKFAYPLQAKIYNLLTRKPVLYPIVSTQQPYETCLLEASNEYMDFGSMMLNDALERLENLIGDLTNGNLKTYGIKKMTIPVWERQKLGSWKGERK